MSKAILLQNKKYFELKKKDRNSSKANHQEKDCPSCPAPAAPSLSLGPPGLWPLSQKHH